MSAPFRVEMESSVEVMKRHPISIDMYKTSSDTFEVVEGDTANLIVITLTDRGNPVDLTGCKVVVSFTRGGSPAEQDTDGHGVTISGEHNNIITVDLYASSFVNGQNTAEVQVWSGENYARLATSAWFNFKGRRARVNEDTLPSVPTFPLVSGMLEKLINIARGIQAKWSMTDSEDPSYIQDKPVIGTDIQSPTNALTVDYTPAGTDEIPGFRPTGGHRKFTLASILGYIRTQLDTYFAPLTHKSRHAAGGADAMSAADILAAKKSSGFAGYTLVAASWNNPTAGLYTITSANLSILSNVVDASTSVEFQPAVGATTAQIQALQAANVQEYSQAANTIVLKAHGIVPSIDIPIRINVRGDVY